MKVIKRDGSTQEMKYDKIKARVAMECYGLDSLVDPDLVVQKVISGLVDNMKTTKLDELAAETAAGMSVSHPDYSKLAARIAVTALHKGTSDKFSEAVYQMYNYKNPETGQHSPQISEELYDIVKANADRIDSEIITARDMDFEWLGWRTLIKSYLIKQGDQYVERPQYMWMRVALGIWGDNLDQAFKTYHLMSTHKMTHATPTLFNAGTGSNQLSSCHLLSTENNNKADDGDSIDGIYDTLKNAAILSKYAGGIGVSMTNVRGSGSYISSTNGNSNGITPFIRVFNNTALAIDQGGGKRKGAIAIYLEPWHCDIEAFLDLKKNHGKEEVRARDLFYAMWLPDLFMQQVESDGDWYLMDPHESPGLRDLYGEEFVSQYWHYVNQGKFKQKVKAREVWEMITTLQIETGLPYLLFKDAVNKRSNQKNLGVIHNSNLCAEILEFSGYDDKGKLHSAVCNLASIAVNKFVSHDGQSYDHKALWSVAYQATLNLDQVIDINFYPLESSRYSNMMMRPMGIGIQGLANVFMQMRKPFDSDEALKISTEISETIYHASLSASAYLAEEKGRYEKFDGSPLSEGKFQFDLWGVKPSDRYNWSELMQRIQANGVRNSLLCAYMPTASTASIMGNIECFEPIHENMYVRRILGGEIIVLNRHMVKDLQDLGIWNRSVINSIIANKGSIQHLEEVPEDIKSLYKTVWEMSQKTIIDMARSRGPFIDQTQSMNLYLPEPNHKKLSSMHFYSWGKGVTSSGNEEMDEKYGWGKTPEKCLKTGIYYLRQPNKSNAAQFTIDQVKQEQETTVNNKAKNESVEMTEAELNLLKAMQDGYDVCESCSS